MYQDETRADRVARGMATAGKVITATVAFLIVGGVLAFALWVIFST